MSLDSPLTAIVRLRYGDPLGPVMRETQTWLDNEKIQVSSFVTEADHNGYALTINFKDAGDADRFRHRFPGADAARLSRTPSA